MCSFDEGDDKIVTKTNESATKVFFVSEDIPLDAILHNDETRYHKYARVGVKLP
jgi:hypothetical protein